MAEWLRQPGGLWLWVAWISVGAEMALLWPLSGWRQRALLILLAGAATALTLGHRQIRAIETRWPQEREKRVTAASQHLAADLHSALHRAERLAESAIASPARTQDAALKELGRLVPSAGPEMSVTVFDSSGEPWAWAGRHRLLPRADGDSFAARTSGYYVVLEARRHSAEGRSAVAGVLIWAHPAVPDRNRSLAELFRQRTEVGLSVYPSGTAPESADVFDYEEPTTAGPRLLFSVQPIPPEQGAAKELVFLRTAMAALVVLLTLIPGARHSQPGRSSDSSFWAWSCGWWSAHRSGPRSDCSRSSLQPPSSGRCWGRSRLGRGPRALRHSADDRRASGSGADASPPLVRRRCSAGAAARLALPHQQSRPRHHSARRGRLGRRCG